MGLGTLVQVVAFGSLLVGILASASDEDIAAGPAFALGFTLIPVWAATVAFTSAHERAPMATLKGMGVWLILGLPLALVNAVVGLSVGFAAGGSFALRSTALRPGRARWLSIAALIVYVGLLLVILPQAALFAGAVTPLLALRIADIYAERYEQQS